MSTPDAAIDALIAALHDGDPVGCKAVSSEAGWASRGDSARRLFKNVASEGLQVTTLGQCEVQGDRAVGRVSLFWPKRGRDVGAPWLLLVREDGAWKLEGVKSDDVFAALFLAGKLSALLRKDDLPHSTDGERWAQAEIARLRAGVLLSAEQVADVWDAPQLGRIPLTPAAPRSLFLLAADPAHVAAHEKLRTKLAGAASIAVTSARSGEGKTTISSDLALGFAMEGKRVLLVDLDLRMPRLYQRFPDVLSGPGVIGAIEGLPLERVIQPTPFPRLDVLTAGHVPTDPPATLRTTAMRAALREARAPYDVVIHDLATAMQYEDPFASLDAIGGPVTTLITVELGRTVRGDLATTRQRFAERGWNVAGLVLNRAPERDTVEDGAIARVELIEAHELPEVGRIAVGLRTWRAEDPEPRERWTYLAKDPDGALMPVGQAVLYSLEGLFEGLAVQPLDLRKRHVVQQVADDAASALARMLAAGIASKA